jgi:dienelactone hydrolase
MRRRAALLVCLIWFNTLSASPGEDLTCLSSEIVDANQTPVEQTSTWYAALQAQAQERLSQRLNTIEQLKSSEEILNYQKKMRKLMIEQLGGFPNRSPLNPLVVGRIPGDGYTIEKVIFESQPNHHVTANLYLPYRSGPMPGVIVASGHSRTAKTADYNQRFGIMLARHGMAALCYDPIGQGERSQALEPDGKPQWEVTTREHLLMGTGSILTGRNTATYRIWDAMRALDYLESRPEIDSKRLGMTGCSGGGTLTSYVMALDERIACAAPACYLTTFGRLLETIGPQDAEQNIYAQILLELDQPDYTLMRAPKPTLISSTTSDFFSIQGAWDNYRQANRIYTRLGFAERVALVEADGNHGVQPESLAAIAQWFQRWLIGKDEPVPVRPFSQFDIRKESELLCTEHGQVLQLPGERSVYDLNGSTAKALEQQRKTNTLSDEKLVAMVRKLAGIRAPEAFTKTRSNKAGKVQRDGYHIDKLVMHTDAKVPLPALTYHPEDPSESAYLYLHDGGKAAHGLVGGKIEELVKQGFVVVSIDLRGQGETSAGKVDDLLGDWRTYFMAYLMGQSVVGAHAEDILAAGEWIANYQSKTPREVHLIAVGATSVAAIHAAAVAPQRFESVTLHDGPDNWTDIAQSVKQARWLTTTVHGALEYYDLPDLIRVIGVDRVVKAAAKNSGDASR